MGTCAQRQFFATGGAGERTSARAIYLHVPFCLRRCRYCDFASSAVGHGDAIMRRYAEALSRLLREASGLGLLDGATTAYVGGGTPTMLGAEGLGSLLGVARDLAPGLDELTFEANPESLGDDVLAAARDAGATRVSIGVQSFDDRELAALGRAHDAALARERVAAALESGLRTSVDLMCGIPYQTAGSWERTLREAVSLGVGHVSCYPLMIEPGTALERMCERGELPWPSDDAEADDMEAAERVLGSAGLARYEVASYARPGQRCRHNVAYWSGVEYLGLGTAAASMLSRDSYVALREATPDLPAPGPDAERFRLTVRSTTREVVAAGSLAGLAFDVEQLTAREAVAEDLMLAARMSDGLPAALVSRACVELGEGRVATRLDGLVARGLLVREPDGSLVPTHSGWLMGNELYGALWDLASEDD